MSHFFFFSESQKKKKKKIVEGVRAPHWGVFLVRSNDERIAKNDPWTPSEEKKKKFKNPLGPPIYMGW